MQKKNIIVFIVLIPYIVINYFLFIIQLLIDPPLLENIVSTRILFFFPCFFIIIYFIKLKFSQEKTQFISELKKFYFKVSLNNKIHHHIEINQINLDNYLLLIILSISFILLAQDFNFRIFPIISIITSSVLIITISIRTLFRLYGERSKKKKKIKALENLIEEQIKNSPEDRENLINIQLGELELILLNNLSIVKFPWISLIFSTLPSILTYFFKFELI